MDPIISAEEKRRQQQERDERGAARRGEPPPAPTTPPPSEVQPRSSHAEIEPAPVEPVPEQLDLPAVLTARLHAMIAPAIAAAIASLIPAQSAPQVLSAQPRLTQQLPQSTASDTHADALSRLLQEAVLGTRLRYSFSTDEGRSWTNFTGDVYKIDRSSTTAPLLWVAEPGLSGSFECVALPSPGVTYKEVAFSNPAPQATLRRATITTEAPAWHSHQTGQQQLVLAQNEHVTVDDDGEEELGSKDVRLLLDMFKAGQSTSDRRLKALLRAADKDNVEEEDAVTDEDDEGSCKRAMDKELHRYRRFIKADKFLYASFAESLVPAEYKAQWTTFIMNEKLLVAPRRPSPRDENDISTGIERLSFLQTGLAKAKSDTQRYKFKIELQKETIQMLRTLLRLRAGGESVSDVLQKFDDSVIADQKKERKTETFATNFSELYKQAALFRASPKQSGGNLGRSSRRFWRGRGRGAGQFHRDGSHQPEQTSGPQQSNTGQHQQPATGLNQPQGNRRN